MFEISESDRLFTVEIRDGELYDDPDALASTTRWYVLLRSTLTPRPINKSYLRMMQGISQWLPDMNITMNLHDVPLIHLPYEERERLIALGKEGRCETPCPWSKLIGQSFLNRSTWMPRQSISTRTRIGH